MRGLAFILVFVAAAAFADVPVDDPQIQADVGSYVTAATNGDDVVVAWQSSNGYVRVARVRGDATVLDVPAKLVARGYHPAIACGGGRCVVIFELSGTVEAAVLSADLDVVRRVRLGNEIPDRPHTVAANDDGFLVTWQSNYYDSNGVLLTRGGDVSAQFAIHKCIVASVGRGSEFAIAALPYMTGWPINTYRVARDGSLMAGPSFDDGSVLPGAHLGAVALASSPNGFLLLNGGRRYVDGEGLGVVGELDATLQPRGPRSPVVQDIQYNAPISAVWDGARYVVAFSGTFESKYTVLPLGEAGVVLYDAAEAALAVTSRGLFVAARRPRQWFIDGYAVTSFSTTPASFTVGYAVANQGNVQMATDGRSALITWLEYVRGQRVALVLPSGERRDIAFGRQANSMWVGFDGRNYVMTWSDFSHLPFSVYAQFVSPDGVVLGDPRPLGGGGHALWNGTHFLVIDDLTSGTVTARIDDGPIVDLGVGGGPTMFLGGVPDGDDFVCAVGPVGSNSVASSIEVVRIRSGAIVERTKLEPADAWRVSIASSGDGFALAWNSDSGLEVAVLDRHLTPVRAPFLLPSGLIPFPSIAWDDSAFVVAAPMGEDIVSVRVTPSGEVSASTVLAGSSDYEAEPCLASWNGALVFAYVRRVTAPPMNGSDRILVRFPPPPPRRRASKP